MQGIDWIFSSEFALPSMRHMDYVLRQHRSHSPRSSSRKLVIGGDVGGTHTNLALAWVWDGHVSLLTSFHFQTEALKDLYAPLQIVVTYAKKRYGVSVEGVSLGLAGPVYGKIVQLTNAPLHIDPSSLKKRIGVPRLHLLNDLDLIGYGVNFLDRSDFLEMPPRKVRKPRRSHSTRAIVGAGTGLGKSILIYDKGMGLYVPHRSEGGHSDFPATLPWERGLIDFIQDLEKGRRAISYEDLLSGRGLERIYRFLRRKRSLPKTHFTRQIDETEEKAPLISQYVDRDKTCREAFRLFLELYAKCARNFALDTLALGGVYLAGGILAKNLSYIDKEVFRQHFEENDRHPEILQVIPIQVVTNYDVSLLGAAFAASLEE